MSMIPTKINKKYLVLVDGSHIPLAMYFRAHSEIPISYDALKKRLSRRFASDKGSVIVITQKSDLLSKYCKPARTVGFLIVMQSEGIVQVEFHSNVDDELFHDEIARIDIKKLWVSNNTGKDWYDIISKSQKTYKSNGKPRESFT